MKTTTCGGLFLLLFGLFFPICLVAQTDVPDDLLSADSVALLTWYDKSIGLENTELRTGTLYKGQRKARLGHPYFKTDNWDVGNLVYRGQYFHKVELLYDISEDQLVIKGTELLSSGKLIGLNRDQVRNFIVHDSKFIYVPDPLDIYQPGYYELIYEGTDVNLLVKRTKYVDINSNSDSEYRERDKYFVQLHDEYHLLRSRKSIFRLSPELKKELKQFVKSKKLKLLKSGYDHHMHEFGAFWEEQLR